MALTNRPYASVPAGFNPGAGFNVLLDASGEKCAFVFVVPETGNLAGVRFRLNTVTTGETLKASLQDVDPATGDPDGTLDQSGTVAVADTDDNTWKSVTFGAARAVVRGEVLAVVIEFDSAVGSLNIAGGTVLVYGNAYIDQFTSLWTKQARSPVVVLDYDDGNVYAPPGCLSTAANVIDFASASTPDERGIRFRLPYPVRVIGLVFFGRLGGGCDLVLYDSDGATVLGTASLDGDVKQSAGDLEFVGLFEEAVDLEAETYYRATVKPSTATVVRVHVMEAVDQGALDGLPGGQEFHGTERTDGGAWTDETAERGPVWLLVEGFDDGASAGGLPRHPGMTGGMPA
jgi:hypothetical protein